MKGMTISKALGTIRFMGCALPFLVVSQSLNDLTSNDGTSNPIEDASKFFPKAVTKNNYDKQAISISYEGEELPQFGVLNGTVTPLDTISSSISLNKSEAFLNCSSGYMDINLKFRQPFYGIVYANFDRNSPCQISGFGKIEEKIKIPLKGCGTLQRPIRVFTNDIVVRFHPGLEIDGDEIITVVCRYPPPIVPPPLVAAPLQLPIAPVIPTMAPLTEIEILMIISAILFLGFMLVGLGCSYYCLKQRNIRVVKQRPWSPLGSDITKCSQPAMFGTLKIPRAQAIEAAGSDQLTESVITDLHSEIASVQSDEDYTSAYSDKMCILPQGTLVTSSKNPPLPIFAIKTKVHQSKPLSPKAMSSASSDTGTMLHAQEQFLTTIIERTETNTRETLERVRNPNYKPPVAAVPPVHARICVKNKNMSVMSDVSDMDESSVSGYSHGVATTTDDDDYSTVVRRGESAVVNRNSDEQVHGRSYERNEASYMTTIDEETNYSRREEEHVVSGIMNKGTNGLKRVEAIKSHVNQQYNTESNEDIKRFNSTSYQENIEQAEESRETFYHGVSNKNAHADVVDNTDFSTSQHMMVNQGSTTCSSSDMNNFDVLFKIINETTAAAGDFTGQRLIGDSGSEMPIRQHHHHTRHVSEEVRESVIQQTGGYVSDSTNTVMSLGGYSHKRGMSSGLEGDDDYDEDDDLESVVSTLFDEKEKRVIRRALNKNVHLQNQLRSSFAREEFLVMKDDETIRNSIQPAKWDVLVRVLNNNDSRLTAGESDDTSSVTTMSIVSNQRSNALNRRDRRSRDRYSRASSSRTRALSEWTIEESHEQQEEQRSSHMGRISVDGRSSVGDRSGTEIIVENQQHFYDNSSQYTNNRTDHI